MSEQNKTPGLVNWLGYLAITAAAIIPLGVLTVRSGAWQQGLVLYALGCLASAVMLLIGLLFLILPRFALWRAVVTRSTLFAIPGTLLLLAQLSGSGDYPAIHDITTDTADPPAFVTAQEKRSKEANSLDIDPEVIASQKEAYPDIKTLHSKQPIEQVFDRALATAQKLGWEVYHKNLNTGVIEAVDTTAIMSFKDDVVIRLRTNAQGTLVDLRSISRVGRGDIGANAKRIREFTKAFRHSETRGTSE